MTLSAAEIIALLGLQPHPTCGYTTPTYRSSSTIPAAALPAYGSSRPYASVLYFLVTPDVRTTLHRIRSDQMYHHYLGDPLEVLLLHPDGTGRVATVGSDLEAGMRPQLLIPGGSWHMSRIRAGGSHALLGTTEWPGFDPADLELGDRGALLDSHPNLRQQILDFTSS